MKKLASLWMTAALLAGATLFAGCSHSEKKADQDVSQTSQSAPVVAQNPSPVNLGASSAGNAL